MSCSYTAEVLVLSYRYLTHHLAWLNLITFLLHQCLRLPTDLFRTLTSSPCWKLFPMLWHQVISLTQSTSSRNDLCSDHYQTGHISGTIKKDSLIIVQPDSCLFRAMPVIPHTIYSSYYLFQSFFTNPHSVQHNAYYV